MSTRSTSIIKDPNFAHIPFNSKRPHTVTKNEMQHKHGENSSRINECSLLIEYYLER